MVGSSSSIFILDSSLCYIISGRPIIILISKASRLSTMYILVLVVVCIYLSMMCGVYASFLRAPAALTTSNYVLCTYDVAACIKFFKLIGDNV